MLDVKVDKRDPTDLYEQVAGEIRRAIADGEAKPGERLPPAKDLAAVLGVNTDTVLARSACSATRGCSSSAAGVASWSQGRPNVALSFTRKGAGRLRPQPGLPPRRADRIIEDVG